MKNVKSSEPIPSLVFAEAILPTRSGKPLYGQPWIYGQNIQEFYADSDAVGRAREKLTKEGFQVWDTHPGQTRANTKINFEAGMLPSLLIAGPPEIFQDILKTTLKTKEFGPKRHQSTHLVFSEEPLAHGEESGYVPTKGQSALADVLEGIALSAPAHLFTPSPTPPSPSYFHLQLPHNVATQLKADIAHQEGFTGKDIRVAMVDTGHFWHPFFQAQNYQRNQVVLAPLASDPDRDDHGHGTGGSANLYAVAPQATLIPVKAPLPSPVDEPLKDRLIAVTAAFKTAASLNPPPDIITCSWGFNLDNPNDVSHDAVALELAVVDAIARNIIVVFAVGNRGQRGFPAQHPDVIAVGGAYISEMGQVQASDLASAFKSKIYDGRQIPDVCGLVGLEPSGQYLMLPVPPNSTQDKRYSVTDETLPNDGWAVFSGTSAAAPQVAGVIALMLQANAELTPRDVKLILQETALDVTEGKASSAGGRPPEASPGPDLATGAGLVNAAGAVGRARTHP